MAYKTGRVQAVSQAIAGPREWNYSDTGAVLAVVSVAGFISDGRTLGMKAGDIVHVVDTNLVVVTRYLVSSVQTTDTGGQYVNLGDTD